MCSFVPLIIFHCSVRYDNFLCHTSSWLQPRWCLHSRFLQVDHWVLESNGSMIILPSSISAYIRSIANLSVSFVYAFIPHQRRFIFLMLRFLVCRISWVHRDDLVSLIMESLSNPAYEGNLVFFFFAQFN
jgi:hypothetical protein